MNAVLDVEMKVFSMKTQNEYIYIYISHIQKKFLKFCVCISWWNFTLSNTDEKGKPVYPTSSRGSPETRGSLADSKANTMEATQVRGDAAAAALLGKKPAPKPADTQVSPTGKSPTEEMK